MKTPVKIALFVMITVAGIAIWFIASSPSQQKVVEIVSEESPETDAVNHSAVIVQSLVLTGPVEELQGDGSYTNSSPQSVNLNENNPEVSQSLNDLLPNLSDETDDNPNNQPLPGLDITTEQWESKRELARKAEAFLLPSGNDQELSPEQLRYASEWEEKALSNQQRISEIESDAKKLASDFIDTPSYEKQEKLRAQGEEAERYLAPTHGEPEEK